MALMSASPMPSPGKPNAHSLRVLPDRQGHEDEATEVPLEFLYAVLKPSSVSPIQTFSMSCTFYTVVCTGNSMRVAVV